MGGEGARAGTVVSYTCPPDDGRRDLLAAALERQAANRVHDLVFVTDPDSGVVAIASRWR